MEIKVTSCADLTCMYCGKEFKGEEPKMCCSGRECACMGLPIEPVVCSDECYKAIMDRKHIKQQSQPITVKLEENDRT